MNFKYWFSAITPALFVTIMAYREIEIALGMMTALMGIALYALYKRDSQIFVSKSEVEGGE